MVLVAGILLPPLTSNCRIVLGIVTALVPAARPIVTVATCLQPTTGDNAGIGAVRPSVLWWRINECPNAKADRFPNDHSFSRPKNWKHVEKSFLRSGKENRQGGPKIRCWPDWFIRGLELPNHPFQCCGTRQELHFCRRCSSFTICVSTWMSVMSGLVFSPSGIRMAIGQPAPNKKANCILPAGFENRDSDSAAVAPESSEISSDQEDWRVTTRNNGGGVNLERMKLSRFPDFAVFQGL